MALYKFVYYHYIYYYAYNVHQAKQNLLSQQHVSS